MPTKSQNTSAKLVEVHGKKLTTTSLIIAEKFDKRHADVLRAIDSVLTQVSDIFGKRNFALTEYVQKNNLGIPVSYRMYQITKDGFMFLVMGFTGKLAAQIKEAFIAAFNEMDERLSDLSRPFDIQEKRDAHFPMMDALVFAREAVGKKTTEKHFINENLFCNRALTGKWEALDESDLDVYDLRLLKDIRNRNMVLMQYNLKQSERQDALNKYVAAYRDKKPRLKLVISK